LSHLFYSSELRICFSSSLKSKADRLPLSDPPLRILTNPKLSLGENDFLIAGSAPISKKGLQTSELLYLPSSALKKEAQIDAENEDSKNQPYVLS
jgi:hypothetical protein